MALRITFDSYLPGYVQWWPAPQLRVWQDGQPLFVVSVILPKYPATSRYEQEKERLEHALLRYAIRQIEQGLRSGVFPTTPTLENQTISIELKDLPLIENLIQEKTCTYQ
jgi:hypothetical protein